MRYSHNPHRLRSRRVSSRAPHFFVFGQKSDGVHVGAITLGLGPYPTEAKAMEVGYNTDFDSGDFECRQYFTVDLARAKMSYKEERLRQSGNILPSLRPIFKAKNIPEEDFE